MLTKQSLVRAKTAPIADLCATILGQMVLESAQQLEVKELGK